MSEVKYGTGAIDGRAGLVQHLERLRPFAANPKLLKALQARMLECFNQKHQLGLMECANPLQSFDETGFDWIVILINCDPESTRLIRALPDLRALAAQLPSIRVRVATSHFMGFGLWDDSMLDLDAFIKRYGTRPY